MNRISPQLMKIISSIVTIFKTNKGTTVNVGQGQHFLLNT